MKMNMTGWVAGTAVWLALAGASAPCAGQAATSAKVRWAFIDVTVYPDTISPRSVTVKGQRFLLRLVNSVGVGRLDYSLTRDTGGSPTAKQLQGGGNNSKVVNDLTLEPGSYTLRVAARAQWTCQIRVEPGN